jgi:hypothetical protein
MPCGTPVTDGTCAAAKKASDWRIAAGAIKPLTRRIHIFVWMHIFIIRCSLGLILDFSIDKLGDRARFAFATGAVRST